MNKFRVITPLYAFSIVLFFYFSILAHAGSISGQVTDSSGNPIIDHYISLYTWDGSALHSQIDISTDDNGKYQITNITEGEYYIEFTDWGGAYLEQAYNTNMPLNEDCMSYQLPISMTADTNLSNISAQLTLGGSILGRVTDSTGAGIVDVFVYANYWDGTRFIRQASIPRTDSNGYYTAIGLSSGDYYLHFDKPDSAYLSQGYTNEIPFQYGTISGKTAINITQGQNISNINIQLTLAGSINGQVTDSSGKGIPSVYVFADTWNGTAFVRQDSIPLTDSDGYYTVQGLTQGDYYLHFEKQDSIYLSQGYTHEIPFSYGNIDYKTPIRIQPGQNFSNINIQLTLASSITGRVTDKNGHGIDNVYVFADTWDGSSFIRQSSIPLTDANGYYTVSGLVSGDYFLHFEKPESIYYSLGYSNEIPFEYGSIDNKTGLRISTGQDIAKLDVQLKQGQNPSTPASFTLLEETSLAAQTPTATINSIVGTLITVTPGKDKVQFNTTGDTPKVQNVLVMLTDQQSEATIIRESKVEVIIKEKTLAIFHPTATSDSLSEELEIEPISLIRGSITSTVNCLNYEVRTSLAKVQVSDSCSCFANSTIRKRVNNSQTKFTTSYTQSDLSGSFTVSVVSGTVDITDREGNVSTLGAGQTKVIQNSVPRTSWVLPIDGDKIYGGMDNMFVWTAYPDAKSYILEYNLPSPIFSHENATGIEYSKQTLPITTFDVYDDLIIYNLPLPKGLNGTTVEARIFALDSSGNIIGESASSDRFTATFQD